MFFDSPSPEERGFLTDIIQNPDDDTPRLELSDWLDEQDREEEAELIRVQCELEPIRESAEDARVQALREREWELLPRYQSAYDAKLLEVLPHFSDYSGVGIRLRRGFPDRLYLPVQWFIEHGTRIRQAFPTLRRVDLFRVNGWGERLARCPALSGLRELEIACWTSDQDIAALFDSQCLSQLRLLRVWGGSRMGGDMVHALLSCANLSSLQEV